MNVELTDDEIESILNAFDSCRTSEYQHIYHDRQLLEKLGIPLEHKLMETFLTKEEKIDVELKQLEEDYEKRKQELLKKKTVNDAYDSKNDKRLKLVIEKFKNWGDNLYGCQVKESHPWQLEKDVFYRHVLLDVSSNEQENVTFYVKSDGDNVIYFGTNYVQAFGK